MERSAQSGKSLCRLTRCLLYRDASRRTAIPNRNAESPNRDVPRIQIARVVADQRPLEQETITSRHERARGLKLRRPRLRHLEQRRRANVVSLLRRLQRKLRGFQL